MSDDGPAAALARCVGDVEEFAASVWGRRSAVHPSGTPASDLLSPEDVDRLVTSSALRTPTFRLVRDGTPLPVAAYTTSGTIGGQRYDGVAAPARVLAAMDDGATLVLQGAHRYHPPLARLCRDLELALGHRCQVNAYLTPPGARGLGLHRDPHDVLVLQAFGSKRWQVHPTPWQRRHEPDAVAAEQVLRPGDVQYLPRGTPHAASAQDVLSGHVTVGILATSWRELLTGVVTDLLADDDTAPEPGGNPSTLDVGWHRSSAGTARRLGERLSALAARLSAADAEALVAARADRFLASRPPLLAGALLDRRHLSGLTDTTRLARRPGAVCRVASRAPQGRVRLLLGDRELDVPAWVAPALDVVLDREVLRPADLSEHLDEQSRLVLCRRLVREGLLAPAG